MIRAAQIAIQKTQQGKTMSMKPINVACLGMGWWSDVIKSRRIPLLVCGLAGLIAALGIIYLPAPTISIMYPFLFMYFLVRIYVLLIGRIYVLQSRDGMEESDNNRTGGGLWSLRGRAGTTPGTEVGTLLYFYTCIIMVEIIPGPRKRVSGAQIFFHSTTLTTPWRVQN